MKPRTRQMLERERLESIERARNDEAFLSRIEKAAQEHAVILERLAEEERELGLEYVGSEQGLNRRERRAAERTLKRVTRRPDGARVLRHPLLDTLTPYGAKKLKRRRAANKRAKQSRKRNR